VENEGFKLGRVIRCLGHCLISAAVLNNRSEDVKWLANPGVQGIIAPTIRRSQFDARNNPPNEESRFIYIG